MKQIKTTNYRKKYMTTKSIGVGIACLPLLIWIAFHFQTYFTKKSGVSMSIGCIISLVCLILTVKGKTSIFKGVWGFMIIFLLCILFNTILNDLEYIAGMALIGNLVYYLLFSYRVERYKVLADKQESAQINAEYMAVAIKGSEE